MTDIRREYTPRWNENEGYPIGLPLAQWVRTFIMRERPLRAADLGSGFTSWLLRACDVPYVVSYEGSDWWAERTREYLRSMCVGVDVRTLPTKLEEGYNFIIADTGAFSGGEGREKVMDMAADAVLPGGYVLFDDFNWPEILAHASDMSKALGWPLISLRDQTIDSFKRYGGLLGPRPLEIE